MISAKISNLVQATFAFMLPDASLSGMPRQYGSGFFVSPTGWFVTAAHVVTQNNVSDGPVRTDIASAALEQEPTEGVWPAPHYTGASLELVNAEFDFALLRVDFDRNRDQPRLKGKQGFPYVTISSRRLDIGEEVYAFGYPLPDIVYRNQGNVIMGGTNLCPRLTSAIVSSNIESAGMVAAFPSPVIYTLDKALNYGNSGGPIIAKDSGNVHALCSRFQPVDIPQPHLTDQSGRPLFIMIPSLYGVVSGLANLPIIEALRSRGVPISVE